MKKMGEKKCEYCRGNKCQYFCITFDGQDKGCRPPDQTEIPTNQRRDYYHKRQSLLEQLLGTRTSLIGSVNRGTATWLSDIDLLVDSDDESKINLVEQELKGYSRFRFHLWPRK